MRHLHFVQSTEALEGGGLGSATLALNAALNAAGRSSVVATTWRRHLPAAPTIAAKRIGPNRVFWAPSLLASSIDLVRRSAFIHGHGFYVATNWIFGREARRQQKPLVYHAHGIFEPWILARSQWKKRIAHLLFEDANFRYACLWRALTGKEADQIRARGIRAPIVVAPNGIDLDVFTDVPILRRRLANTKGSRSLLFLARLHPKKGLDLLLNAWAAISPSLREGWVINIAGPDELNHRGEIEALAASLDLSGQLNFTGTVRGHEKLSCLAEADAFVLPSRSEGFSVAILEAMACRLPVLATNACNFQELATDGGGWCVNPSVDGIKVGLESLLRASGVELMQRGAAARSLVESRYTWAKIAEDIDQACNSVASVHSSI